MSEQYQVIVAAVVFIVTYVVIVSEKIHRMVAAFIGAGLLLLLGVINLEAAVHAVDFNTIGLLVGMMLIVGITRTTGVFEFLSIKAAKVAGGEPVRLIAALALITAILSALLDNVTTVLLIAPVTLVIAGMLEISPLPFLISEIIASNIGGTATLIGDPPNIMIGSATQLGFMDFVINLAPVVVVIYIITFFIIRLIYGRQLTVRPDLKTKLMELDEQDEIKDPVLLRKCLLVLTLTILGFVLHQFLNLESAVVALFGASLLLLLSQEDPEHALQAVEWPVIFFFIGLFVVVGALEEVGIIQAMAKWALDITGGSLLPTGILVLWLSAIASSFVDNIPFVATMIPLLQEMSRLGGITDINFLWWSLALGACLGGNGTIVGASANLIVVGIAERKGHRISFLGFMKIAFPLMLLSIVISTGYLLLWYNNRLAAIAGSLFTAVVLYLLLKIIQGKADKT
ncbi:MAG: ArsB/NhaD family transporter [Desulfotomaculaceae bacterium]|nr:ArsB/NhaD family transporter [Desulfotomaculaceae bacterium]